MLDISAFDFKAFAEAGSEVRLLNPVTGKELDAVINIIGEDSAAYRDAIQTTAASSTVGEVKSWGQKVNDMAFALAAVTTGWSNISDKGVELSYSKDAAMALYAQHEWIADQVFSALKDRERFLVNA